MAQNSCLPVLPVRVQDGSHGADHGPARLLPASDWPPPQAWAPCSTFKASDVTSLSRRLGLPPEPP